MPKGNSMKATKAKTKEGIKKFESMNSTAEPEKEQKKDKKKKQKQKQKKEKDGEIISWKRQNIWFWQPRFTISKSIPLLFIVGIVCSIIGAVLLGINSTVREAIVEYTECKSTKDPTRSCHEILNIPKKGKTANNTHYDIYIDPNGNNTDKNKINPNLTILAGSTCKCNVNATEEIGQTGLSGQVFLYYHLDNLYQNHRQYVKSRDNKQLLGDMSKIPEALSDIKCTSHFDFADKENKIPYFPCGAIANSLFNDTIKLQYREKQDQIWKDVPVSRTGIAHPTDIKYMFGNPPKKNITDILGKNGGSLKELEVEWPKDWGTQQKKIWDGEEGSGEGPNVGFQNEDFIIWMRTAASSSFRKLYAKIGHNETEISALKSTSHDEFKAGLPGKYEYQFVIEYNYNAISYSGRKKIILSTVSGLGGKASGGGFTYFFFGFFSIIISISFVALKKKGPKDILDSCA